MSSRNLIFYFPQKFNSQNIQVILKIIIIFILFLKKIYMVILFINIGKLTHCIQCFCQVTQYIFTHKINEWLISYEDS